MPHALAVREQTTGDGGASCKEGEYYPERNVTGKSSDSLVN